MSATIHLGYQLGTGEPVSIPLRHTAITGQTQEAGKTTALEALISRAPQLRALTFVTKRGEGAFQESRTIRPYFRERADWQYVSAILEATLREKLKFERSWIMKVCKGADSLADVQRNIERDLEKARGLNESVLTTLHAYLEIVLPQIQKTTFAPSVDLKSGVNVMDLSGFRLELQSLIIRSAIEWVYEREDNTVVIIPEAWEFIPQNRASPVKLACEMLIRKGAALKNYVWLDSQDIAGVHKDILRSVPVWILGVQREKNEVARTLSHIPGGAKKPKVDEVMELGLGEFFVSHGKDLKKVYVQPAWMDPGTAQSHARGEPVDFELPSPTKRKGDRGESEAMWKEKYDDLKRDYDDLKRDFDSIAKSLRAMKEEPKTPPGNGNGYSDPIAPGNMEDVYGYIKSRLLAEKDPGILQLLSRRPEVHVKVERPVIEIDDSTVRGRLVRLIAEGFFDESTTASAGYTELKRLGVPCAKPGVYKEMDKLTQLGIVTKESGEGYRKSPDAVIRKA